MGKWANRRFKCLSAMFSHSPLQRGSNNTPKLARCLCNCRLEYLLWHWKKKQHMVEENIQCFHPRPFSFVATKVSFLVVSCSWFSPDDNTGMRGRTPPPSETLARPTVSLTLSGAVALNRQKAAKLKISHWLERSHWPGFPCHCDLRQSMILMLTLLFQHSNF